MDVEKRKKHLAILMAAYSLLYLAFGLVLLAYPRGIIKLINEITEWLGAGPPLDIPTYPFWAVVTVSLLLTLSLICYLAFRDVENTTLIWVMIFAKYVSSIGQIGYFAVLSDHPPGFVVGALTDCFLGTVALVFLIRAKRGIPAEEREEMHSPSP